MKVLHANRENIKKLKEDTTLSDEEKKKQIKGSEDIIWKIISEKWGTVDLQDQIASRKNYLNFSFVVYK